MYEHKLHPYNGLETEPNPEDIANSVLGAIFGFAVGTTLCYHYQGCPPRTRVNLKTYLGGGPEHLDPGALDALTYKALEICWETIVPVGSFGEPVMGILRPDYKGTPTMLMEESHRWALLNQSTVTEDILGYTLGPAILFRPDRALTVTRMVQNHPFADAVVWDWLTTMKMAITEHKLPTGDLYYGGPIRDFLPQDGKLASTFNNSVLWAQRGLPFIRTLELICGQGAYTTITGGVTGALMGAIHGVKDIPMEYINGLGDSERMKELGVAAAKLITGV